MSVKITQLVSYPIKSCAGIEHESVAVDAMGLKGDRQWMLVDENNLFLSQRKHPKMALIQPLLTADKLTLNAPAMQPLSIALTDQQKTTQVTVWKDHLQAEVFGDTVNQWFTEYLKTPVKLVHYGQQSFRQIDPDFANAGQAVAFADGYPLLVAHQATLDQVNQQLSVPVGMDRFRPNIVVSSDLPPWAELQWQQLLSSDSVINLVKPCARCVMTGVNQNTGKQTGTEVLKTLRLKFPHQDKAVFGINGIASNNPDKPLELSLGQTLEIQ